MKYIRTSRVEQEAIVMLQSRTEACLIWPWFKDRDGYGILRTRYRNHRAHRWAWELENGRPIPPSLQPDHLCRTPACFNPDHLEVVTSRVNTLRGFNPCAMNARKTHCVNGHALIPENLYYQPGFPNYRRCAVCRKAAKVRARVSQA